MIRKTAKRNPRPRRREAERSPASPNKRSPKRRLKANMMRAFSLVGVLLFALVIWLLLASDLFTVHQVTVVGNRRVASPRVIELSGLTGRNMFAINTTQARQAVACGSPLIKDVYLEYHLPSEVTIRVDERTSFAAWKIDDTTYDVSRDGTILGTWDPAVPLGLVVEAEGNPLTQGDTLDAQILVAASRLQQALPGQLGMELQVIRYSEAAGLKVTTTDGLEVQFGSSDEIDAKLAALQSVLTESRAKNLTPHFIDVRFNNRPYFR